MNAIDPIPPRLNPLDTLTSEERKARDERTNAFLASEAFIPFVLDCFTRGVRRAAAEEAELIERARRGT